MLALTSFGKRDNFYLVGLAMTERDLVTHDTVFDRIAKGSIEEHLNLLALDESHLYDALTETAMS